MSIQGKKAQLMIVDEFGEWHGSEEEQLRELERAEAGLWRWAWVSLCASAVLGAAFVLLLLPTAAKADESRDHRARGLTSYWAAVFPYAMLCEDQAAATVANTFLVTAKYLAPDVPVAEYKHGAAGGIMRQRAALIRKDGCAASTEAIQAIAAKGYRLYQKDISAAYTFLTEGRGA